MLDYETLYGKVPGSEQELLALTLKQNINDLLDQYESLVEYWIEIIHNPISADNQGVVLKVCLRSDNKSLVDQLSIELSQISSPYKVTSEEYDVSTDIIDEHFPDLYIESSDTIEDFDKAFDPGVVLMPDSMPLKYKVDTDKLLFGKNLTRINFLAMTEKELMAEAKMHPEKYESPEIEFNLHKILFIEIP